MAKRISIEDISLRWLDNDLSEGKLLEHSISGASRPYHWKNIDPVVCGILWPRTFLSNIDAYDLKFLYDFDSVYEVRIKGKGFDLVEQAQSIVNIAKRDYMNQLLSSKKVVITLFFPFHESEVQIPIYNSVYDKLTVLFADLENNNVDMLLQTRNSKKEIELELWIVYGE